MEDAIKIVNLNGEIDGTNYPLNPEMRERIARAYESLAIVEMDKENYRKAVESFEKYTKFRKPNTRIINLWADCYLHLGEIEKAKDLFRRM